MYKITDELHKMKNLTSKDIDYKHFDITINQTEEQKKSNLEQGCFLLFYYDNQLTAHSHFSIFIFLSFSYD